jgi:HSP20 family protein
MATGTRNKDKSTTPNDPMVHRAPQHRRHEMRRWEPEHYAPFAMMRDMQEQVDRWFNRIGVGNWTSPSSWASSAGNWMSRAAQQIGDWTPAIDAFQRGNEFIVRADVPGMTRNDLSVEIGDDAITIHGERKHEQQEERDGVYWSERSYGSFSRVIPLPPGAISDSAKANFNNGVLEVVIQSPSQEVRRGRKVDITGHDEATKK